jgi:photosystem II stability/assembly factor-like uncharacterized protein
MTSTRSIAALFAGSLIAATVVAAPAASAPVQTLAQGVAHDALFAIAIDGSQGLAAGVPGKIMESADGGKSWTRGQDLPTPLAMLGVDLKDGHAIAVGQMGSVYIRQGAGAWAKAETGSVERLMNVALNRRGLAVAVGAFGTVLRSRDYGKSWQPVAMDWKPFLNTDQADQGIQPHLSAVHVGEDGAITVAGEFSLILRSLDEGASWTALNRGEAAIFALELRSDGIGYAVGQDGLILRSADGGASWTRLSSDSSKSNLLGVRSLGGQVVVSAMHDMLTSQDGGQSWQRVQAPDVQAGWYSGVAVGGQSFMTVGHTGRIIRVSTSN